MKGSPQQAVVILNGPRPLPQVRFRRHRSARALLDEFFRDMGGFDNIREAPAMLATTLEEGLWAFAATRAKPCPVVHYWARRDVDRLKLAFVLGHEVGHVSGRPLKSRRNDWREELRADEYGAAAFLAMREVLSLKPAAGRAR